MDQQNQNQQYQQNPYYNQNIYGGGGGQQPVDNATVILVLGIISIVICGLGPILGTVALVLAKGARKQYEANPAAYQESSYKTVKSGKICAIIGLCVGILCWIWIAAYFIFLWYVMSEAMQVMEQYPQ